MQFPESNSPEWYTANQESSLFRLYIVKLMNIYKYKYIDISVYIYVYIYVYLHACVNHVYVNLYTYMCA